METRAHHLLIGIFMLVVIIGLFVFIIWLSRGDLNEKRTAYDIFFEGSVAGLSVGSTVQFNGIPVGQVRDISIAPDDPSRVRVTVWVEQSVPVNVDTQASLEAQGLTGVAIIQLRGGTADSPALERGDGQPRPVIPSQRSPLQELFEDAPTLLNSAIQTLSNIQKMTGPENQRRVADTLDDMARLTAALNDTLAGRREGIDQLFERTDRTLAAFEETARAITALSDSVRAATDTELAAALTEAQTALAEAGALFADLDRAVAENRGAVRSFTNNTLPEASRLVVDLRRLTQSLQRVADQLADEPSQLLFGRPKPVVKGTAGNEDTR
ncbi:phospholipid/cholesterol/gamma-HCH transport system substrate-binding protein [Rhodothalassium salexigens DSM 2132]|uniref:Phospholipid/cholesterol/gamma-HCH transport system substrate-binding protein n=1 Tax=Rhodothalassium salexigens DSM 2132 TaxID=1188247 RepID=A0A4R2PNS7_RHOSA|nr:MlaD family protein [Rhodothalassium salexigens]MBB4210914.1 phospholipid/cholesterol/gamma-HCH transport system substrate-binding protein [Rhodothalassium salexigens DSM 2132]MBK1639481.1 hypothetical protein [Rhodothalassium salexigens DSM 2132]TCP36428.1 phospholipid/cholesterol/gamma-HCH transport system substrate-binding protein [Rhodothalassium salexigens DSM 2132]